MIKKVLSVIGGLIGLLFAWGIFAACIKWRDENDNFVYAYNPYDYWT